MNAFSPFGFGGGAPSCPLCSQLSLACSAGGAAGGCGTGVGSGAGGGGGSGAGSGAGGGVLASGIEGRQPGLLEKDDNELCSAWFDWLPQPGFSFADEVQPGAPDWSYGATAGVGAAA